MSRLEIDRRVNNSCGAAKHMWLTVFTF